MMLNVSTLQDMHLHKVISLPNRPALQFILVSEVSWTVQPLVPLPSVSSLFSATFMTENCVCQCPHHLVLTIYVCVCVFVYI